MNIKITINVSTSSFTVGCARVFSFLPNSTTQAENTLTIYINEKDINMDYLYKESGSRNFFTYIIETQAYIHLYHL